MLSGPQPFQTQVSEHIVRQVSLKLDRISALKRAQSFEDPLFRKGVQVKITRLVFGQMKNPHRKSIDECSIGILKRHLCIRVSPGTPGDESLEVTRWYLHAAPPYYRRRMNFLE